MPRGGGTRTNRPPRNVAGLVTDQAVRHVPVDNDEREEQAPRREQKISRKISLALTENLRTRVDESRDFLKAICGPKRNGPLNPGALSSAEDPLSVIVECFVNHPTRDNVTVIDKWLKVEENKSKIEVEDTRLQDAIFWSFAFIDDLHFAKAIFKIFNLSSSSEKSLWAEVITQLPRLPYVDVKRALVLITSLEMFDLFTVEDVVIPAIIKNLSNDYFDPMLMSNKSEASRFVQWLDDLTVDNFKKVEELKKRYGYLGKNLNFTRFNSKSLDRLIKSLVEKYSLSFDYAPRYSRKKKQEALWYNIRYARDSQREDVWREVIDLSVRDDYELQLYLIKTLEREDFSEAVFWAKKLNLPKKGLPWSIVTQMERDELGPSNFTYEEENWDDDTPIVTKALPLPTQVEGDESNNWVEEDSKEEFLTLPFDSSSIHFIDSREGYTEFIKFLKETTEYSFGLDSEFVSKAGLTKESADILQISTSTTAYLIDLYTLKNRLSTEEMSLLNAHFFQRDNILVVGYGLGNDYSAIQNVHPVFEGLPEKSSSNWLDLNMLISVVCKGTDRLFDIPAASDSSLRGLTSLCQSLFGKPLDKTYQVSDWTKRPLRPEQLLYAALDAHICISVYKKLEDMAEEVQKTRQFSKWIDVLMKNKNKVPKDMQQKGKKAKQVSPKKNVTGVSRPLNKNPINPPDLKVVCDTMLQGLCKKLRLRGVDAVSLASHEPFENCAKVAEKEKRMILTRGAHAHRLQFFVKKGHVLQIYKDNVDDQIKEVFFYFNVLDDDKYLFSRCPKCNCDKYVNLPSSFAKKIKMAMTGGGDATAKIDANFHDFDDESSEDDQEEIRVSMASLEMDEYFYCDGYEVHRKTANIRYSDVQLRLKDVPDSVINAQENFYGCVDCGKMFWEGSHWDRFMGGRLKN